MNNTNENLLTYRDLLFAKQDSNFKPESLKIQSMLALLNWDFSNPVLMEPVAEKALVEFLEQERQKENILPVVDLHQTEAVLDALLMADWNIDRKGEKVVLDYYKDNISLFGPRIEILLNGWLDGPDQQVIQAKEFVRFANSVWFQMLEMVNVIARAKPDNCNKVLLRILNDDRVPVWFKGEAARALGKVKEKRAEDEIIELAGFWDYANTLSNFIEALKDLRSIKAIPLLSNLLSNLNQLIDEDFKLVGEWYKSKEGVAAALGNLIPNKDREPFSDATIESFTATTEMKKLRKNTEYAIAILGKISK